jgi:hypothetical protein
MDNDAALARALAEQWNAEEAEADDGAGSDDEGVTGAKKKEWASDAATTNCFLSDVKFSVVNRKHHCRYCGQIFVDDVCKKKTRIPSMGYTEAVRVCDICYDQIERGDPVCIAKQVALLRSESESQWQQGAKALADWASMDPQFATSGIVHAIDALKVPELLVERVDGHSSATQGAVARLLSAILKYDEYREMMERVDLLEPLLSALKSSSTDTKVNAVATIATLTVNESGRDKLRRSGGLVALIDVLLSATGEKLQEVTCEVLANMCEDQTDDWRQMAQNGATFALVGMLSSRTQSLQEAALTLLAILSRTTSAATRSPMRAACPRSVCCSRRRAPVCRRPPSPCRKSSAPRGSRA